MAKDQKNTSPEKDTATEWDAVFGSLNDIYNKRATIKVNEHTTIGEATTRALVDNTKDLIQPPENKVGVVLHAESSDKAGIEGWSIRAAISKIFSKTNGDEQPGTSYRVCVPELNCAPIPTDLSFPDGGTEMNKLFLHPKVEGAGELANSAVAGSVITFSSTNKLQGGQMTSGAGSAMIMGATAPGRGFNFSNCSPVMKSVPRKGAGQSGSNQLSTGLTGDASNRTRITNGKRSVFIFGGKKLSGKLGNDIVDHFISNSWSVVSHTGKKKRFEAPGVGFGAAQGTGFSYSGPSVLENWVGEKEPNLFNSIAPGLRKKPEVIIFQLDKLTDEKDTESYFDTIKQFIKKIRGLSGQAQILFIVSESIVTYGTLKLIFSKIKRAEVTTTSSALSRIKSLFPRPIKGAAKKLKETAPDKQIVTTENSEKDKPTENSEKDKPTENSEKDKSTKKSEKNKPTYKPVRPNCLGGRHSFKKVPLDESKWKIARVPRGQRPSVSSMITNITRLTPGDIQALPRAFDRLSIKLSDGVSDWTRPSAKYVRNWNFAQQQIARGMTVDGWAWGYCRNLGEAEREARAHAKIAKKLASIQPSGRQIFWSYNVEGYWAGTSKKPCTPDPAGALFRYIAIFNQLTPEKITTGPNAGLPRVLPVYCGLKGSTTKSYPNLNGCPVRTLWTPQIMSNFGAFNGMTYSRARVGRQWESLWKKAASSNVPPMPVVSSGRNSKGRPRIDLDAFLQAIASFKPERLYVWWPYSSIDGGLVDRGWSQFPPYTEVYKLIKKAYSGN